MAKVNHKRKPLQPTPEAAGKEGFKEVADYNWVTPVQPWHRAAAFMAAHGGNRAKLARAFNKTPLYISNLMLNGFFQDMIREEMAISQRDIRDLFYDELITNLEVLKSIRDNRKELAAPRITAIRELNDRALGRPVQPIETEFVSSADPVLEVERLEAEIRALGGSVLASARLVEDTQPSQNGALAEPSQNEQEDGPCH